MTELTSTLLSKKVDKRNSFYDKNESLFSDDELMFLIENIEYDTNDDNDILIHSIAMNPNLNLEMIQKFALSGEYGNGAIKAALMNTSTDAETLRKAYNQPKDHAIWKKAFEINIREFGKDYFESISQQVNEIIENHPNCPTDI
jgi:hypothetical protein